MSEKPNFVDILKPRHTQFGIFKFMTRPWIPQRTLVLDKCRSPQELKELVANSVYMDAFLEAESAQTGIRKEKLRKEMLNYLEEIGLEKKLYVIRWIGIVFLKISFMMKVGMFVNESAVLKLKSSMGNNPVLFLPTHRSYADFCLMTYLCFHYDIDFPAVAAGMDFYSMAVVGQRMRETCAFYIRRTLAGAPLYAATLRRYVRTLVANHCAPIEFFLEGTRSRSNKSLPPKFGMLSMSLMPYFAREVTDVTIVPVNISYDRLMEQSLFAYEHLGVPKPKESTGGLLKSLHSLNDNFGNIYINLGAPISLNEYLKADLSYSSEIQKPVDLQQLTGQQSAAVQDIANLAVTLQQDCTIVTISSLLSMVLMQSLMRNVPLHLEEVLVEVGWLVQVLRTLGATVYENDVRASVERILLVHRKMITLDRENRLRLVSSALMEVTSDVQKKMKGHTLRAESMVSAVPVIQLQMYVNPVLHYLVPPAIICLAAQRGPLDKDSLADTYRRMRRLLSDEFFHIEKNDEVIFHKALEYCLKNGIVSNEGNMYVVGGEHKLQYLLNWVVLPSLTTLLICTQVMGKEGSEAGVEREVRGARCGQGCALRRVQARAEAARAHPYCLSLEAAANCLLGLVRAGALLRHKTDQEVIYETVPDVLEKCRILIESMVPKISADFGVGNSVITSNTPVLSRL